MNFDHNIYFNSIAEANNYFKNKEITVGYKLIFKINNEILNFHYELINKSNQIDLTIEENVINSIIERILFTEKSLVIFNLIINSLIEVFYLDNLHNKSVILDLIELIEETICNIDNDSSNFMNNNLNFTSVSSKIDSIYAKIFIYNRILINSDSSKNLSSLLECTDSSMRNITLDLINTIYNYSEKVDVKNIKCSLVNEIDTTLKHDIFNLILYKNLSFKELDILLSIINSRKEEFKTLIILNKENLSNKVNLSNDENDVDYLKLKSKIFI